LHTNKYFMSVQSKNLKFLVALLEACGMTKVDLAKMMGKSPQNIFKYFQLDDMKLSFAQEIAEKMGYRLSFRLEAVDQPQENVSIEVEQLIKATPGAQLSVKRMSFLRLAMSIYDMDRKTIADHLGLAPAAVTRWFAVDDIYISYIFRIAEAYNLHLSIKADTRKVVVKEDTSVTLA